jgi:hypothetical protein
MNRNNAALISTAKDAKAALISTAKNAKEPRTPREDSILMTDMKVLKCQSHQGCFYPDGFCLLGALGSFASWRFQSSIARPSNMTLAIAATQHDSPHAILQQRHPEVDQQTKWAIHRFHVRDDLCLMNRSDHLHSLQFDDQDIFDQEIKLSAADWLAFVKDLNLLSSFEANAPGDHFDFECFFVDDLQVPRPEMPVHFDGSANDRVGRGVVFRARLVRYASRVICHLTRGASTATD